MQISTQISVYANLIAALNASSTRIFQEGDVWFSNPAEVEGSDQTYQSEAPNSTITITGVEDRGYRNSITRTYRRVPLNSPVAGAKAFYPVNSTTTFGDLVTNVCLDRGLHLEADIYPFGEVRINLDELVLQPEMDENVFDLRVDSDNLLYIGSLTVYCSRVEDDQQ